MGAGAGKSKGRDESEQLERLHRAMELLDQLVNSERYQRLQGSRERGGRVRASDPTPRPGAGWDDANGGWMNIGTWDPADSWEDAGAWAPAGSRENDGAFNPTGSRSVAASGRDASRSGGESDHGAGHGAGAPGRTASGGAAHYSTATYTAEPILKTGRQMKNYLPPRCREMMAMSRYEAGTDGERGRWLTDEEFFYRQGTLMADYEDDCPYPGVFKSYYPTYSSMSDQQLRGYFTWRAQVRRGIVEETSLSFAYVYLYELICGIGVAEPLEGFSTMERFWKAYREFAPELDRYVNVWLQDYVVYHGLPPELLAPYRTVSFDRALLALHRAGELARAAAANGPAPRRRGADKAPASALPLPADEALETELFDALDALSTYRLKNSRYYKANPAALRHVACAVYVRLSAYYDKNRKTSLLESWFGEHMEQGYIMFASAVFFEPEPHPDCVYELDPIHRYRCKQGRWSCERYHGSRQRSGKLGSVMRAVDRSLRAACGFAHPLKDDGKTPKYLQRFIDAEVAAWQAWQAWQAAHAPRPIRIDLSQLAGIRAAAAGTREALLVDEEREGAGAREGISTATATAVAAAGPLARGNAACPVEPGPAGAGAGDGLRAGEREAAPTGARPVAQQENPQVADVNSAATGTGPDAARAGSASFTAASPRTSMSPEAAPSLAGALASSLTGTPSKETAARAAGAPATAGTRASTSAASPLGHAAGSVGPAREIPPAIGPANAAPPPGPAALSPAQARYLRCLLKGAPAGERLAAAAAAGLSEDLLVDAVNEALFDLVGDTVVEFGEAGPQLVEDYADDVREVLGP